MVPRFLAIRSSGGQASRNNRLGAHIAQAKRDFGLAEVFDNGELLVLANPAAATLQVEGRGGAVIGDLFHRDASAAAVRPGDTLLGESVVQSKGESLLRRAWGGYVALIWDEVERTLHVLRDPSGAMPCFHVSSQRLDLFFSDIEPVLGLEVLRPVVDRGFLAHHLTFPNLRSARTGLAGVSEVLAGTRVSVRPNGTEQACAWSPWRFAGREAQLGDRGEAIRRLREETERCVRRWGSLSGSILLELSGGLDSSIVAACLAGGPAAITCVTLVTPDPGADERRYAALVAAAIDAPLVETPLKPASADLRRAPQNPLPRPGLGALQQVIDQALIAEGQRLGVDAFLGGGGGDNVFCYLVTAAPAVDALLTKGLGATALGAVDSLAQVHGCTTWRAAILTMKKALRGPRHPWRPDLRFTSPDIAPKHPDAHPWLDWPANALPGKIEHVANLMRIQTAPDGKERPALAPVRHPLLSQPIVELCLNIPSWMWISGGQNRSVARDAFQDRLPPEIIGRRTKGEFSSFSRSIYARNRSVLREYLIGGWLDGAGLLDRVAIEAYLAQSESRDSHFYRLLEIAGVEAWARSWSSRDIAGGRP